VTTTPAPADAFLLFGATGDLARKKLFPALYELTREGRADMPIVGIARSDWSDDDLRARARESIVEKLGDDVDAAALDALCGRLRYLSGDYTDSATWGRVEELTGGAKVPVSFLAIPPSLFDDVVEGMAGVGMTDRGRVVVEKPFGRDLASARELNATLHKHLDESQIFRIDHFLGKEPVQNLMVFRFANSLLEPVWNRDEKVKVFRAMKPLDPAKVVRGQVEGYLDETGVEPGSDTETFAAMEIEIDSWRWAGVPFYIRAGKSMAKTVTEAVVEFKQPPSMLFADVDECPEPSRLRFRMKPDDNITLTMQAKVPGMEMVSRAVDMTVDYEEQLGGDGPDAYERLMADAIIGDERLFARQDGVEEAWRIVEPMLSPLHPVVPYPAGSSVIVDVAAQSIDERGIFTMAISGGSTPRRMLEVLAERPGLDWGRIHLFQVDERVAPDGDPDRNATMLAEALLTDGFRSRHRLAGVWLMPVTQSDVHAAADEYAATIDRLAGSPVVFDLVQLGLGSDGHTASLIPDDPILGVDDRDVAVTGAYNGRQRLSLTWPVLDVYSTASSAAIACEISAGLV